MSAPSRKSRRRLLIPLRARGGVVGVFAVGPRRSEEPYSDDDRLTLATLANQMAIAIENARLYRAAQQELAERKRAEEEILRRAAQQEALNAIIAAAAAERELIDLLEAALEHTLQALGARAGTIWVEEQHLYRGLPQEFSAAGSRIQDADLDVTRKRWCGLVEIRKRRVGSPVTSSWCSLGARLDHRAHHGGGATDRQAGSAIRIATRWLERWRWCAPWGSSGGRPVAPVGADARHAASATDSRHRARAVMPLGADNRIILANLPAQASLGALTNTGRGVQRFGITAWRRCSGRETRASGTRSRSLGRRARYSRWRRDRWRRAPKPGAACWCGVM